MGEVLRDRVCQFPRCRHHRRGRCLVRHTSIRVADQVEQMEEEGDESDGKQEE
jgi:hypothetical protein